MEMKRYFRRPVSLVDLLFSVFNVLVAAALCVVAAIICYVVVVSMIWQWQYNQLEEDCEAHVTVGMSVESADAFLTQRGIHHVVSEREQRITAILRPSIDSVIPILRLMIVDFDENQQVTQVRFEAGPGGF